MGYGYIKSEVVGAAYGHEDNLVQCEDRHFMDFSGHDGSKCTDYGNDCCASDSWGEPQTCKNGYISKPTPWFKCTSSWNGCVGKEGGIGCYGCFPPHHSPKAKACDEVMAYWGSGHGFRDSASKGPVDSKNTGATYGYSMVGNTFGDHGGEVGAYIGVAGYINTGDKTIKTNANVVYVAHHWNEKPIWRGESGYSAPHGPYKVCISEVEGGKCGADREFPPDSLKYSIFGYTSGSKYFQWAKEGSQILGAPISSPTSAFSVREELMMMGAGWPDDPKNVKIFVNGQEYNEGSALTTDVDTLRITDYYTDMTFTFPKKFNYGGGNAIQNADSTGQTMMQVTGTDAIKIRVHGWNPEKYTLNVDYLFPVDSWLKGNEQYFIYDPDITVEMHAFHPDVLVAIIASGVTLALCCCACIFTCRFIRRKRKEKALQGPPQMAAGVELMQAPPAQHAPQVPSHGQWAHAPLPPPPSQPVPQQTQASSNRQSINITLIAGQPLGFANDSNNNTILSVDPGSQAERAGIQAGDIVTAVEGIEVRNDAEFGQQYGSIKNRPNPQFTLTMSIVPRKTMNSY
jgi:hypothetical protein